jgi:hypothetical protein
MRAWAQRLRGDLQVGPPHTGVHEWKNAQWSNTLQGKGVQAGRQADKHSRHTAGCRATPLKVAAYRFPLWGLPNWEGVTAA